MQKENITPKATHALDLSEELPDPVYHEDMLDFRIFASPNKSASASMCLPRHSSSLEASRISSSSSSNVHNNKASSHALCESAARLLEKGQPPQPIQRPVAKQKASVQTSNSDSMQSCTSFLLFKKF